MLGGCCNHLKGCWDFCSDGNTQGDKPHQPKKTLRRPLIYVLAHLACAGPKNATQIYGKRKNW